MDFEKLVVWQRAKTLAVNLYKEMAECGDVAFKSQITRSGLSIPSNIAEGMERFTAKEKCRFLSIAKASCGELRTQIIIGSEIGYIREPLAALWISESRELSKMLSGLINKISD
ncbi:four helix bundle protein [Pseudomonas vancouverensis]|uniref:four helix bundle protein n=1 Tax=Pseudomonas vancouverensis TaxID=95300 RepID=UPI003D0535F5